MLATSEGLKGALVGMSMVVLDGKRRPSIVLTTNELVQPRFDDVDEQFAYDEGEGDRSLAYWREAHKRFWHDQDITDDTPILCEYFRVVERLGG